MYPLHKAHRQEMIKATVPETRYLYDWNIFERVKFEAMEVLANIEH